MSNLQEDAKPEIIVEHSNVDVIAALLVLSIIVRALGIGDRQVSYGDRVLKDCKDRRTRCEIIQQVSNNSKEYRIEMQIPNATAYDIGLRVDSENREDWNAFLEEEGNWTHGEVWDEGIVESSSSVGGNKIGVEVALEKHGLYMLGSERMKLGG